jgi:acyl-CoA thioesterase-1
MSTPRHPSRPAFTAIALALLAVALIATAARAVAAPGVLLVVGDSISAGYGLPRGTGWVDLLAARIDAQRLPFRVVNASVTGDTTAGGRARLPALLAQHKPAIVVVELGGNDGLRGGSLKATKENLDAMLGDVKKSGARALLVGMRLPPNYGPAYTREFDALYGELAKAHRAALVPFLFAGFGESSEWFQPDRIHPTAAAQAMLLDNVWPVLAPLLAKPR